MVHTFGTDSETIGLVEMADLGLQKCSNCNQENKNFNVSAIVHVNKIFGLQAAPKFGSFKAAWIFQVMCPTCEKGYQFLKEKGRDEVQQLMMRKKSLIANVKAYFLYEHGLFNHVENRDELIKYARKRKKTILEDLAKLGMNDLVHELLSCKDKYPKNLKLYIESNKNIGFDIEL
ncbi:hypothetical protein OAJ30_03035 [Alphaproteobacteria bacterium]|nr:hypothetical protein [Alphaproteobacteria bacterium]